MSEAVSLEELNRSIFNSSSISSNDDDDNNNNNNNNNNNDFIYSSHIWIFAILSYPAR